MRLVLYQKLLHTSSRETCKLLFPQLASSFSIEQHQQRQENCSDPHHGHATATSGFDLSLQQLQAACQVFNSSVTPAIPSTTNTAKRTRLVVRLNPSSADDVLRQFNSLNETLLLQKQHQVQTQSSFDLDLVIVRPPIGLDVSLLDATIDYLYQVLPYGAQFLEAHPSVGSFEKHGQRNAHGNPMDRHVIGVCHDFSNLPILSSSVSPNKSNSLAKIVDVLPPTRLSVANMEEEEGEDGNDDDEGNDFAWEAVRQSTDHLDFHDGNAIFLRNNSRHDNNDDDGDDGDEGDEGALSNNSFASRVWKWQRDVACAQETYATCSDEHTARIVRRFYDDVMMLGGEKKL